MDKFKRLISFFKIKRTFIIVAFLLIALGNIEQFFILFFCVTAHELTHVIAAYLFGCKTNRVILSVLGETALIKGLDTLELYKKIIILFAGPAMNFALALCTKALCPGLDFFMSVNLSLAVFNLLPVYPLDGGKIVQYILGEATGAVNSHKFMSKLSSFICCCFITLGFVQVVLYPYNISLICIGFHLIKINKKQYPLTMYEFYKSKLSFFTQDRHNSEQKIKPVQNIAIGMDLPVKHLVNRLSWNRFYLFTVIHENSVAFIIDELQLMKFVSSHGINKTVGELCKDLTS